jgi:hypothetical protein
MSLDRTHEFLPPSGAACWRLCAMWPTMNALYPELEPSEEAIEGEAAHWVWAEMLLHRRPVALGQIAPNGAMVDEEMLDGAETFCTVAHGTRAVPTMDGETGPAHIEEKLNPVETNPRIHPKNGGTPDLWRLQYDLKILEYKYGHAYVPAFESWQCINYAALIMDREGIDGIRDQTLPVSITVVQPRNYHQDGPVRTWTFTAADIRPHINELRMAAERATVPNPVATPGPVQCEYCPGRHVCPALLEATNVGRDHSVARAAPVEMSPAAAGRELSRLTYYRDLLNARIDGIAEQNMAFIRAGKRVPGWGLRNSGGRERWKNPEHAKALGAIWGVAIERPAVITPNQARNLGIPDEVVAAMAETPTGKAKLVPDDDAMIRRIFGQKPT